MHREPDRHRAARQPSMTLAYEKWLAPSADPAPRSVIRALRDARLDSFLADTQDDGVMVIDAAGIIVDANLALSRRTGFSRDEVLGRAMVDVIEPSQRRRIRAAIDDALAGDGVRARALGIKRSGEGCELAITFVPLFDDDRTPIGALVITQNLSEAADAERGRERDEALLALAARVAGFVGWSLDLSTGALGWSGDLPELRGRTPETLDALIAMLTATDAARLARALDRCGRDRRTLDITLALRVTEGERHVRFVGRVNGSGAAEALGVREISGAAHDVTAAVLEERQRRSVEELLSTTVNAMTDGFAIIDAEWRAEFVNDRMVEIVGLERDAIIGGSMWELMPELVGSRFERAFRDAVEQGSTVQTRGWAEKRRLWLDIIAYPSGRGLAVHLRDITEEVEREEAMRRAERLESLGSFAGGIAHDLNNVLTPIMLASQMLGHALADTPEAETVEMIETAALRGASMVRQVLTFARGIETGDDHVEVTALLDELERMVADGLPHGIDLTITRPVASTAVRGDATQLLQVLANLVSNAKDAIEGAGTITVDARLEPGAVEAAPTVVIDVTDSGHGMTPEVIAQLWEPFFTTKPVGKGTGLGLVMVAAIVRAHGGTIEATSDGRSGSRFTITLPAALESPLVAAGSPTDAGPRGDGRTVLIVDDEQPIRALLEQILRRHGYEVIVARGGWHAEQLLRQAPTAPDAVLSDVTMPEGDGIALVRSLIAQDVPVPVVVMSGRDDASSLPVDVRDRCVDVLVKPLGAPAVLTAINAAITSATSSRTNPREAAHD